MTDRSRTPVLGTPCASLRESRPVMTFSEQAAVLHVAAEHGLLTAGEILGWAFGVIDASAKPPLWVIELATLPSPRLADLLSWLREHGARSSLWQRLQILIAAHEAGRISLTNLLPVLFRLADRHYAAADPPIQRLVAALWDWDCEEDFPAISAEMAAIFTDVFADYLQDAEDMASLLRSPARPLATRVA